jgi:hypothetical protein
MNFITLGPDVTLKVFSYLDPNSKCVSARVCKDFCKAASNEKSWKQILEQSPDFKDRSTTLTQYKEYRLLSSKQYYAFAAKSKYENDTLQLVLYPLKTAICSIATIDLTRKLLELECQRRIEYCYSISSIVSCVAGTIFVEFKVWLLDQLAFTPPFYETIQNKNNDPVYNRIQILQSNKCSLMISSVYPGVVGGLLLYAGFPVTGTLRIALTGVKVMEVFFPTQLCKVAEKMNAIYCNLSTKMINFFASTIP